MLYADLDLSRKRLDFHLLDADGVTIDVGASPPDADGLRALSERLGRHGPPIRAAIESMNGARFVHDRLELAGWQVEIADAQKVKGLAPLACKTDRIDAWVLLAYTIAAEIGDIARFPTPRKLAGYNGLCPRVYQSDERDLRGPLSKQGPRYLRWALVEAATHACTHPAYRDRYQQTKARIGKQRGAKVAHARESKRRGGALPGRLRARGLRARVRATRGRYRRGVDPPVWALQPIPEVTVVGPRIGEHQVGHPHESEEAN